MCTIYHFDMTPLYVPSLIHPAIWALVYIYCHVDARCVARGRGGAGCAKCFSNSSVWVRIVSDGSNIYIYIMGLIRFDNQGAVFTLRVAWVLLVPLVRLVHLVLFLRCCWSCVRLFGQPAVCLAISDSPPPSLHDYSIQLDIWTQQCPTLHDASSVPF